MKILLFLVPFIVYAHSPSLLVFTKTAGYRHDAIANGIDMFTRLAAAHDADVTFTEDGAMFRDDSLQRFDVVVFMSTTGDVLDAQQQAAFERYIRAGGGFVGIHAASDTEYEWTWYGGLVGTYFQSHQPQQPAELLVEDHVHASTRMLPRRWQHYDEWYDFRSNPRGNVHVLVSVNAAWVDGSIMGYDHPISWCQQYDGGRSWYTALGHSVQCYTEQPFVDHVWNGVLWAAGLDNSDATASLPSHYHRNIVLSDLRQPMQVVAVDDTTLLILERNGIVYRYHDKQGTAEIIGDYHQKLDGEYGALGLELAEDAATTGRFYIYLADVERSQLRLLSSVLTPTGIDRTQDVVIFEAPFDASECCHAAGDVVRGENGSIYLSLGDNTNPFESKGYAPLDEGVGRQFYDAQRTAGNTNDVRGKILHITPRAGGGYDIPAGNLFPVGAEKCRPEIYCMGVRNPFRITYDAASHSLFWGDVGPDAYSADAARGPRGYDELNRATHAGSFGWPYFIADDQPYVVNGTRMDPVNVRNTSPNNTGLQTLPPPTPALMWYSNEMASGNVDVGEGGRCILSGVFVHTDSTAVQRTLLPYFDKTLLVADYIRCWIKAVHFDDDGQVLKVVPLYHDADSTGMLDMCMTPNGTIYVIGWRERTGSTQNSILFKLERTSQTSTLQAIITPSATDGPVPLRVVFDGTRSTGDSLTYAWDLGADGSIESTEPTFTQTFSTPGSTLVQLTVHAHGATSRATVTIVAGNTHPDVRIVQPVNGSVADLDAAVSYVATVTDAEDGMLDGANVVAQISLGHDDHAHPMSSTTGARGMLVPEQVAGHGAEADIFGLLTIRATDNGAGAAPVLASTQSVILQPRRKQAEFTRFDPAAVDVILCNDVEGGKAISSLQSGDAFVITPLSLRNVASITVRYSAVWGGDLSVRKNGAFGPEVARVVLVPTGSFDTWRSVTATVQNADTCSTYYFVALRNDISYGLYQINWIEFTTLASVAAESNSASSVVTLAPNPTTGDVHVSLTSAQAIDHVDVVDALGRLMLSTPGTGTNHVTHDCTAFGVGTYAIIVHAGAQRWTEMMQVVR